MSENKSTERLLDQFQSDNWTAVVMGLGYVGLPLAVALAGTGVKVVGFDTNPQTISDLSSGISHIDDVPSRELSRLLGGLTFSTDPDVVKDGDAIFICVPTPLSQGKTPQTAHIEEAARTIRNHMRRGQLVVLESTSYPGTTDTLILPVLADGDLRLDEDFLLACAPERIDPGSQTHSISDIPRVVGGVSTLSCEAAVLAYKRIIHEVVPVASAKTAEMTKLLENTFRWVNIAFINEMALISRSLHVDIWEVVAAAATKPFGFMPFTPGPGVGGHCIPLDPFYLQWAARSTGASSRFVELAESVNNLMPSIVVGRIQAALNESSKPLRGSSILLLGVSYKANVRDYRESAALDCWRLLEQSGARLSYVDPNVPMLVLDGVVHVALEARSATYKDADCVVLLADHDSFDHTMIASNANLIFDVVNGFGRRGFLGPHIRTL